MRDKVCCKNNHITTLPKNIIMMILFVIYRETATRYLNRVAAREGIEFVSADVLMNQKFRNRNLKNVTNFKKMDLSWLKGPLPPLAESILASGLVGVSQKENITVNIKPVQQPYSATVSHIEKRQMRPSSINSADGTKRVGNSTSLQSAKSSLNQSYKPPPMESLSELPIKTKIVRTIPQQGPTVGTEKPKHHLRDIVNKLAQQLDANIAALVASATQPLSPQDQVQLKAKMIQYYNFTLNELILQEKTQCADRAKLLRRIEQFYTNLVADFPAALAHFQEEKTLLQIEIDSYSGKEDEFRKQIEVRDVEIKELQEKIDGLLKQIEIITNESNQKDITISSNSFDLEYAKGQIQQLQFKLKAKKDRTKTLKDAIKQRDEESKKQLEQIEKTTKMIEQLQQGETGYIVRYHDEILKNEEAQKRIKALEDTLDSILNIEKINISTDTSDLPQQKKKKNKKNELKQENSGDFSKHPPPQVVGVLSSVTMCNISNFKSGNSLADTLANTNFNLGSIQACGSNGSNTSLLSNTAEQPTKKLSTSISFRTIPRIKSSHSIETDEQQPTLFNLLNGISPSVSNKNKKMEKPVEEEKYKNIQTQTQPPKKPVVIKMVEGVSNQALSFASKMKNFMKNVPKKEPKLEDVIKEEDEKHEEEEEPKLPDMYEDEIVLDGTHIDELDFIDPLDYKIDHDEVSKKIPDLFPIVMPFFSQPYIQPQPQDLRLLNVDSYSNIVSNPKPLVWGLQIAHNFLIDPFVRSIENQSRVSVESIFVDWISRQYKLQHLVNQVIADFTLVMTKYKDINRTMKLVYDIMEGQFSISQVCFISTLYTFSEEFTYPSISKNLQDLESKSQPPLIHIICAYKVMAKCFTVSLAEVMLIPHVDLNNPMIDFTDFLRDSAEFFGDKHKLLYAQTKNLLWICGCVDSHVIDFDTFQNFFSFLDLRADIRKEWKRMMNRQEDKTVNMIKMPDLLTLCAEKRKPLMELLMLSPLSKSVNSLKSLPTLVIDLFRTFSIRYTRVKPSLIHKLSTKVLEQVSPTLDKLKDSLLAADMPKILWYYKILLIQVDSFILKEKGFIPYNPNSNSEIIRELNEYFDKSEAVSLAMIE